jgi:hypothetical protein
MTQLTKADLAEIAAKQAKRDIEHDEFFLPFENAQKNQSNMRKLGGGNMMKKRVSRRAEGTQSRPATPTAMRNARDRYVGETA